MNKVLLLTAFNADNLAALLENDKEAPGLIPVRIPYAATMQALSDGNSRYFDASAGSAVVWTTPAAVSQTFGEYASSFTGSMDQIEAEVDEYASLMIKNLTRVKQIVHPSWTWLEGGRGLGPLDMKKDAGLSSIVAGMNRRLAERMDGQPGFILLDAQKWVSSAGRGAYNPKLWYMAKIPFSNQVFSEMIKDLKSCIRAAAGQTKKLLVLDLDDTLWGGVLGDVGPEGIVLGGHDPSGEAFVDFQKALKSLKSRGVLLALSSKNDEKTALKAIGSHPEMVLRTKDFSAIKINWKDKAENIISIAKELGLGLQSVVFIDDNPFERARVREALPEAEVPEWPEDKMLYRSALFELRYFDSIHMSEEDKKRAAMYEAKRSAEGAKKDFKSLKEWLKSLRTAVEIEKLGSSNLQRAAQLLNKTNQMNLSTRRLSEGEFMQWAEQKGHETFVFSVSDRFGQSGLTGIVSIETEGPAAKTADFVLSCRVIGRDIEKVLLAKAVSAAKKAGTKNLSASHIPTKKNAVCLEFFRSSGMKEEREGEFTIGTAEDLPYPPHIEVREK